MRLRTSVLSQPLERLLRRMKCMRGGPQFGGMSPAK